MKQVSEYQNHGNTKPHSRPTQFNRSGLGINA